MKDDKPLRQYLGSLRSWGDRTRVYRSPEALEVDHIDHWEIRRRRVFFDEVLLVTLHETRIAGPYPWLLGALAGIAALIGLAASGTPPLRLGAFAVAAVSALSAFGILLSPVWVLTAFGRRTRARMNFRFREGKAREIYADICRSVNEAQRRADAGARFGPTDTLPLSSAEELPLPPPA